MVEHSAVNKILMRDYLVLLSISQTCRYKGDRGRSMLLTCRRPRLAEEMTLSADANGQLSEFVLVSAQAKRNVRRGHRQARVLRSPFCRFVTVFVPTVLENFASERV